MINAPRKAARKKVAASRAIGSRWRSTNQGYRVLTPKI